MNKKVVSLLVTLVFIVSLTGIVFPAYAGETISVLMGVDAAGGKMVEKAEEFEKLTGIKVNLTIVSWEDLTTKEAVALGTGVATYDVVDTWRGWVSQYAPAGYYVPLTDKYTKDQIAEIAPALIEAFSNKGILYAAPLMSSWTIMFYNKKMFEEAGLNPEKTPRIWKEFIDYSKKLTKDIDGDGTIDQYGYIDSFQAGEAGATTFLRFLKANGGEFWEIRNGRVYFTFNSPQGVGGLELMKDLIDKYKIMDPGVLTYDQQDCAKLFADGRAAMFNNWEMMAFILNDPEESKIAGHVGYALPPGVTEDTVSSMAGHEGLAIPTASKHKEAAWRWIEFITSKENTKARAIEQGFTPVYVELFSDPDILQKMPQLAVVLEAGRGQVIRPPIPEYQQVSDIITKYFQLPLLGKMSAKEALDAAAREANELVGWKE